MALVAVGLLTIGGGAAAVYAQSTTTVVMAEFTFNPDRMVVSAGRDTFTLRNAGQFPHNVHIEGNGVALDVKPDGPVAGGQTFTGVSGRAAAEPPAARVAVPVAGGPVAAPGFKL